MMQEYPYLIAGELKTSARKISVVDPAQDKQCAVIFETPKKDIDYALYKARISHTAWRATAFKERASLLREIAGIITDDISELARLETQEIGKPHKESLFIDIPLGAESFTYYASLLESLEERITETVSGTDVISYDPFGVCIVYLPYNTPCMIFGFIVAAALAAGNAVVVKPSEYGSLSILHLAKALSTLDVPKGLISIVSGKGESVGKYLSEVDADLISFTGSRDILKKVISQSAKAPKKIICELGGCNITAVYADAARNDVIENILGSSFLKQGQMCIGTSVVLVEENAYDDIIAALVEKVSLIKLGDPFDSTVGMGPLLTKEHVCSVDKRVKELISKGAKLLCGGEPLKQQGYFYPPTIIAIDKMLYEEFFAPVILVKKCTAQEIETIVTENPTGLVLQIWSSDVAKAKKLARLASCGTVWINTFAQLSSATPFGGMGQSGWGRNLGKAGFFEYVQQKHIGIGKGKSPVDGWFGI